MADVTSTFANLSSTESSNSPVGSTAIGANLDNNMRMIQSHVAAWRDQTAWGILTLTSVSGTNTITATLASAGSVTFGPTALAAGMKFLIVPANTNTGATTLNITSPAGGSALGAKSVFYAGRACIGGELKQSLPVIVEYDGTQFNILGPIDLNTLTEDTAPDPGSDYLLSYDTSASGLKKVLHGRASAPVLVDRVAAASQTSLQVTGIPSYAKRVTVNFMQLSTSGTSALLVQIGNSGGFLTSAYDSAVSTAAGTTATNANGFIVTQVQVAAGQYAGHVHLTLQYATDNAWSSSGIIARTDTAALHWSAGDKALMANPLDRVRVIAVNGTDTFDNGSISVTYE